MRLLFSRYIHVSPGAVTLLVSTAVIVGAEVIASALPAFRAARVHPAEALRSE